VVDRPHDPTYLRASSTAATETFDDGRPYMRATPLARSGGLNVCHRRILTL
jgi:hypothetical protein